MYLKPDDRTTVNSNSVLYLSEEESRGASMTPPRSRSILDRLAGHVRVSWGCLANESAQRELEMWPGRLCRRVGFAEPEGRSNWFKLAGRTNRGRAARSSESDLKLAAIIRAWSQNTPFDGVVVSSPRMLSLLEPAGLGGVPVVVDLCDSFSFDCFAAATKKESRGRWWPRRKSAGIRELVSHIPDSVRAVIVHSEAEAGVLRDSFDRAPVVLAPHGVGVERSTYEAQAIVDDSAPPAGGPRRRCILYGDTENRLVAAGLRWFCREVWSELAGSDALARLTVIQPANDAIARELRGGFGIELERTSGDARSRLEQDSVLVVPVASPITPRATVLEGMATSMAVVTTREAASGLDAVPGQHLFTASTRREWIDTIRWLWQDESLRFELGSSARRYVEAHQCWDACVQAVLSPLGLRAETPAAPAFESDSHFSYSRIVQPAN